MEKWEKNLIEDLEYKVISVEVTILIVSCVQIFVLNCDQFAVESHNLKKKNTYKHSMKMAFFLYFKLLFDLFFLRAGFG